jgi:predicted protein tyrosine phosphatase
MFIAARALSYESMKDLVCNQTELLNQHTFISIAPDSLRAECPEVLWPQNSERWLSLFFDDIRPEHLSFLPLLQEHYGRPLHNFDEELADTIIDFLELSHKRPSEEVLYVNCIAGISRSGAITSFACETFGFDRKKFMQDNPRIMPNNLMLYTLRERWQLRHPTRAQSARASH